jgi:hypothetical protein
VHEDESDELARPGVGVPPSDAVPRATTAARESLQVPLAAAEGSAGAAAGTGGEAEPAPCEDESDELARPACTAAAAPPSDAVQTAAKASDELMPPGMTAPCNAVQVFTRPGDAKAAVAESVANVAATDDAGLAAAVLTAACAASSSGAGPKCVIDQGTKKVLRSALMTAVMSRCARCGCPGWLVSGFARR